MTIKITSDENIQTKTIENDTQEEYILHLTDATGEFVSSIRSEYKNVLQDIINKYFE